MSILIPTPPPTVPHSPRASLSDVHAHVRRSHSANSNNDPMSEDEDLAPKGKKRRLTPQNPSPLPVSNLQPSPPKESGPPSRSSSSSRSSSRHLGAHQAISVGGLAKPVGFAASREQRREEGQDVLGVVPSPVVMGFDFQTIDEEQLKTVHKTISIKEQQQALIAARRLEATSSNPSAPLTGFNKPRSTASVTEETKSRQLQVPVQSSVGKRREKMKDKVEKMSIKTGSGLGSAGEMGSGSKSAPLNQGLMVQQATPRDIPSGSQTALPPYMLPGFASFHHMSDPRTAPLSNTRTEMRDLEMIDARGGREGRESHEFARQQQQGHFWKDHRGSLGINGGSGIHIAGGQHHRPHSHLYSHGNGMGEGKRIFTVPVIPRLDPPSPRPVLARNLPHSHSRSRQSEDSHTPPSPLPPFLPSRESFISPFLNMYDSFSSIPHLSHSLNALVNRSEELYGQQMMKDAELKRLVDAANGLLGSLQTSADSLREMVRYEVERAHRMHKPNGVKTLFSNEEREQREKERQEIGELRERIRHLEELLQKNLKLDNKAAETARKDDARELERRS
nr:hypothetical protein L204_05479 [Cryptococcus depauperatus CBS 7855]